MLAVILASPSPGAPVVAIFNYFEARWSDGRGAVDDAPASIATALREWIDSNPAPDASLITLERLPRPVLPRVN